MSKKKRILCVDDEVFVLQGLERMLRSMRDEWDMDFVESGSVALEQMARRDYDAVISDMKMPGMNGAELLNEVMRRHPRTVRLILSGQSDQALIVKCVGSTHQYLSKPCEAATFKATVKRALALNEVLHNEKLATLAARIETLPSLPSLYTEVVACLQSAEVSMADVGRVIAQDIAMTAKILKLVNSAFFGLGRPISCPGMAAAYLGAETLKTLVLSTHLFAQYQTDADVGFSLDALWAHSLRTAAGAKAIARTEHVSAGIEDEAFTAGMLHDIGKLVLGANFPVEYQKIMACTPTGGLAAVQLEMELFGSSHAELGGYLLALWGLTAPVVEAVALHHSPLNSPVPCFGALAAVHAADGLVQSDHADRLDLAYLAKLGLAARLPVWECAVAGDPTATPAPVLDPHPT